MNRQPKTDESGGSATRLESSVVQLSEYVRAKLLAKLRIQPKTDKTTGERYVEVDSYHVPISRILGDLLTLGWHGDFEVRIGDNRIATLHVK
ncbi:hypothetical protein [Cupriavidus necator]|uniref:hypothetical protein n=1 Tax=Cupriavidus necator TaxID=106590 RepID=UPI00140FFCDC|nr:hypothetical protein [Cupriavidus necator]